ncbi:hypothetical protein AVEN_154347-1 [Araneus ventricosus]|uniref:Uncharacterized protein n=1 Tax=Araneus ventricosus TaxID=182803 RepID=A0A4Y2M522_ARAVE|nr:hypothetical protein AVEN_154347-1 [Araneus ventricosus]
MAGIFFRRDVVNQNGNVIIFTYWWSKVVKDERGTSFFIEFGQNPYWTDQVFSFLEENLHNHIIALDCSEIPVVADLPVGDNFHDHCAAFVPFTLGPGIPTVKQKLTYPQNIQEYIDRRTGPLASAEFISTVAFLNSGPVSPNVDFPDYQLYFAEISNDIPEKQTGLKPEVSLETCKSMISISCFDLFYCKS